MRENEQIVTTKTLHDFGRSDDIKHVYWKPPNELEQSVQEAGCSLITLAGDVYSLAVVIMEIVSGNENNVYNRCLYVFRLDFNRDSSLLS